MLFYRPEFGEGIAGYELQLGCLRLSSKKLAPYAVAQKASKLQARIKEIQESLQCPCPSKYRLTYSVDGAEVPSEIARDRRATYDFIETACGEEDVYRRGGSGRGYPHGEV